MPTDLLFSKLFKIQFKLANTNLLMEQKPVLDFSEIQDDVILEMAEVSDVGQRNRFAAAC